MHTVSHRSLVAVVAALLIGFLAAGQVHSQDAPPPTQLACIDLRVILEGYRKVSDIAEQAQYEQDALKNREAKQQEELELMVEELQTLNPDSDDYERIQRDVEMGQYMMKRDREFVLRRLERRVRDQQAMIYREICQESQAYGEENGFAAVLQYSELPAQLDHNTDLELMMAARTAVWRDDSLDVTAAVLERLNAALPPR